MKLPRLLAARHQTRHPAACLLAALWRHPRAAHAAKALFERDLEARVPIAIAELIEYQARLCTVRAEQYPVPRGVRVQQIVHAEVDRHARRTPICDECGHVCGAIEVRIELVRSIESEALIVVDVEAVGEAAGIAPDVRL